jgi:hypothetical protein
VKADNDRIRQARADDGRCLLKPIRFYAPDFKPGCPDLRKCATPRSDAARGREESNALINPRGARAVQDKQT